MEGIIRETELLKKDLTFIRVSKIHIDGSYVEMNEDINEFISFCRSNDISTVFYKYAYYDKERYIVTEELLEEYTENNAEKEYIRPWAEEYNRKAESLDFSAPCRLALCASFGSITVVCSSSDYWMDIDEAEKALLEYQEEHEDELLEFYEYEEGSSLMDELASVLLADKTFRYATNKEMRSDYMRSFLSKKANKRFWALTKGAKNEYDRVLRINTVVNQIYNEYRNHCYRLKIQVGEELPKEE